MYYHWSCLRFNVILVQEADPGILIPSYFICSFEDPLYHWKQFCAIYVQICLCCYIQIAFSYTGRIVSMCFILKKKEIKLLNGYIHFNVSWSVICVHYFNHGCSLNMSHTLWPRTKLGGDTLFIVGSENWLSWHCKFWNTLGFLIY